MSAMNRIDVHSHVLLPAYRKGIEASRLAGYGKLDGIPALPEYDPETHIALMDRLNISKTILSASSPGTNLSPENDTQAREFTHQVNIEMAELCEKYPDRFDFFASLPLPDVAGALEEIDYALDTLHAVGFQILSNSNSVYPGDPELDPIFEKLNNRKAIIFFHPTSCHITVGTGEAAAVEIVNPNPRLVRPMMEFMFDSTRAVANLLLFGTAQRCSDITFVVCHCGAALAPLFERIVGFSKLMKAGGLTLTVEEATAVIQDRFYFDLGRIPISDPASEFIAVNKLFKTVVRQ